MLKQFVVRSYTSALDNINTVNRARYEMFQFHGKSFDDLPPTQNALNLHIQRAAYTAGHIYLGTGFTEVSNFTFFTQLGLRDEG